MLKYIEFHASGLASVEIPHVFPRPAKRFTRLDLQAIKVDLTGPEKIDVRGREIFADDPDQLDWGKKTGPDSRVRSRTAKEVGMLLHWSFNGIESNGSNDENRHGRLKG